jgi:hypothetical protein
MQVELNKSSFFSLRLCLRVRRKGKEMPIPHIVWKWRVSKTPNLGRKALKGFFKIKKKTNKTLSLLFRKSSQTNRGALTI